jgi:hypothetical protein
LAETYQQERGVDLLKGPDGRLYLCSVPVKQNLGGALTVIDPRDDSYVCHRNIIPDQSVITGTVIPGSNRILFVTSIGGGTKSVPVAKQAVAFVWDCSEQRIVWQDHIVPGARIFGQVVYDTKTDKIFGVNDWNQFYVFDPVTRTVVHRGRLPIPEISHSGFVGKPLTGERLILGYGDGKFFAVDTHTYDVHVVAEHPSVEKRAYGFFLSRDGGVYYGKGSNLWRFDTHGLREAYFQ